MTYDEGNSYVARIDSSQVVNSAFDTEQYEVSGSRKKIHHLKQRRMAQLINMAHR